MKQSHLRNILFTALALALAAFARATDRIELADGSVVFGKLLSAAGGKFKLETAFAGTIEIAQDQIKSFTTDTAVNVALATGSTVQGRVEQADAGLRVVAADGALAATPAKVTAVWRVGEDSPATRAAKEAAKKARHAWKYEAALAVNGRTGAQEKFAGAFGFKATLESSADKLIFNLAAEKAKDNGVETANRQMAGADYSAFFNPLSVWYARTTLEKDSSKSLDLRSTTAFGIGRKLIKRELQDLELRLGVSYTFESYANGTKFDSPGLDVALIHSYQFKNGKLNNAIAYTPAFKNFSNYRVHHETSYEVPLTASLWKLKMGIANDYISLPQPGVPRLDTLYFTSLILNWE